MKFKMIALAALVGIIGVECMAQKKAKKTPKWDAKLVQVKSSADGTMQPCWYWAPEKAKTGQGLKLTTAAADRSCP